MRKQPLKGKVALVAGATRGAGRGIACMLGEAGAIVYCSGRSTREHPTTTGFYAGRPETIDETAEMVTRSGGAGIPVRTDHLVPEQVEALVARVRREQRRLDVLVNDISEGETHEWKPFWKLDLEKGFRMLRNALHSHIITCRYAAPLMIDGRGGLIVEIGDGDTLDYRATLFYDLVKISVSRLAFAMAEDLLKYGVAAVAITPGYMRTEAMLDHFGVQVEDHGVRSYILKPGHLITDAFPTVPEEGMTVTLDRTRARLHLRGLVAGPLDREAGVRHLLADPRRGLADLHLRLGRRVLRLDHFLLGAERLDLRLELALAPHELLLLLLEPLDLRIEPL